MSSRVICRFREILGVWHASVDLCVSPQCAVSAPMDSPQYAQHAHMLAARAYYGFQFTIISSSNDDLGCVGHDDEIRTVRSRNRYCSRLQ